MLVRTKGIVFHTIPYADSKIIAKIYTRDFGLQSFIINVSRSKTGKLKSPFFQPLTQIEISIQHREKNSLHTLRDVALAVPYGGISNDIRKTSIALFVAEVLYKSVKEEVKNEDLYDFLSHSLQVLDLSQDGIANFHLVFLMKLTRYLGFYPQDNTEGPGSIFDLKEGVFRNQFPDHSMVLDATDARWFETIMQAEYEDLFSLRFTAAVRQNILGSLLKYYETHLSGMHKVNSHEILASVF